VFTDKEDVADYTWEVGVNLETIGSGLVLEHWRPSGAGKLLETVAKQLQAQERQRKEEQAG
jgi:hypothetical protein